MSKNKRRHNQARSKTVQTSSYDLRNIKTSMYHGAARFLEIAPPGIQFRSMTNVDHITFITFSNHIEEVTTPGEEGAAALIEQQHTGFDVIIGFNGQQRAFTFHRLEVAVTYYNDLLDMLAALGVPCAMKPRIQFVPPPVEEEKDDSTGGYEIVGADGKPLAADNDNDDSPYPMPEDEVPAEDTSDDDDLLNDELDDLLDDEIAGDIGEPTEH